LLGERGVFLEADASRWEDVGRLVEAAVDHGGRLDAMVLNAGIAGRFSKSLLETTEEDWDAIMAVNLRGVFLGCKAAVTQMLTQEPLGVGSTEPAESGGAGFAGAGAGTGVGSTEPAESGGAGFAGAGAGTGDVRGRIVNISSQHGMVGPPGHVAYAASKGGVVNLTRQLAVDYGPRGILVNAVAPGKILTGSPEQQDPDTLAYSHARTPFHRLGRPDDVAGAALFLASDDCGYVSGVNLLVDGGWMAY
jgi:NAD(P)-dependent dehydrogenase (short-subunit alcohol dehydrogenase family)